MSPALAVSGLVGLAAAGVLVLAAATRKARRAEGLLWGGAVVAVAGAALMGATHYAGRIELLAGGLVLDAYSGFVGVVVALCGAAVLILSLDAPDIGDRHRAEYVSLVLLTVLGAALMPATTDFAAFFVALQLASIPLYVLAGFRVTDRLSTEAAFKFMLLGMLASAILLYGFSMAFAQNPSTRYAALTAGSAAAVSGATAVALVFMIAGFVFKAGAAPLHFWIPDTYQGSAVPVAALLATVPKCAAIAALLRFSATALAPAGFEWARVLIAAIAVLSMTLGNVLALVQTDVRRLLAYSGIAQVGYILVALAVAPATEAAAPALFYAAAYALTNLGAFAVVQVVAEGRRAVSLADLDGMWKRSPLAAGALALFVISMLGLPPTPGFWAKFGVISLAVQNGAAWLAVVVVVNSLVSVAYYVRVMRHLFVAPAVDGPLRTAPATGGILVGCLAALALVGLWPSALETLARSAAQAVGAG